MLSNLDQEHDGHLVAEVDDEATFTYSVPFIFFIHSFNNVYWALFMPTLRLSVLFVFDEGSKYTEVSNIWTLPLRSSEPNKEIPKFSQLMAPLVS